MYKPVPKWWVTENTPAAMVVQAFGGPGRTALRLGVSRAAVSQWRKRGTIPKRLEKLALRKTKKLNTWMLVYGRPKH